MREDEKWGWVGEGLYRMWVEEKGKEGDNKWGKERKEKRNGRGGAGIGCWGGGEGAESFEVKSGV